MARFLKKHDKMIGKSPDSLVFVGSQKVETIKTRVIDYDETVLSEKDLTDIKDGTYYKETKTVTWIC